MTVLITRSPVRSARRQRGQALAEAVVALALLVPLFLLIPMLGKYAHIEQAVGWCKPLAGATTSRCRTPGMPPGGMTAWTSWRIPTC